MKTWKHFTFVAVLAIFTFAFTACDDGNDDLPEKPQFRETAINLTFGEDTFTATVQGTLLEVQWKGVANKIETTINRAYETGMIWDKDSLRSVFSSHLVSGVIIIVEKTTDYVFYKTIDWADGTHPPYLLPLYLPLYLNIDNIGNLSDTMLYRAFDALSNSEPQME